MLTLVIGGIIVPFGGGGGGEDVVTGGIIMYGGASSPDLLQWLICDGSAVSRTTYAALFGIIGTTFGAGDTVTTFNLPDFRKRSAWGTYDTDSLFLGSNEGQTNPTNRHLGGTVPAGQTDVANDPGIDPSFVTVEGNAVVTPVVVTAPPHNHLVDLGSDSDFGFLIVNFLIKT